jgi:hypothetical protein
MVPADRAAAINNYSTGGHHAAAASDDAGLREIEEGNQTKNLADSL